MIFPTANYNSSWKSSADTFGAGGSRLTQEFMAETGHPRREGGLAVESRARIPRRRALSSSSAGLYGGQTFSVVSTSVVSLSPHGLSEKTAVPYVHPWDAGSPKRGKGQPAGHCITVLIV